MQQEVVSGMPEGDRGGLVQHWERHPSEFDRHPHVTSVFSLALEGVGGIGLEL